jgi:hypothetical protein
MSSGIRSGRVRDSLFGFRHFHLSARYKRTGRIQHLTVDLRNCHRLGGDSRRKKNGIPQQANAEQNCAPTKTHQVHHRERGSYAFASHGHPSFPCRTRL